jgi:hypothetical protein
LGKDAVPTDKKGIGGGILPRQGLGNTGCQAPPATRRQRGQRSQEARTTTTEGPQQTGLETIESCSYATSLGQFCAGCRKLGSAPLHTSPPAESWVMYR